MDLALFAPDGGEMNDGAGRPQWITENILDTMLAAVRESSRPRGAAGGSKVKYSPTAIETYMRCPYGWFLANLASIKADRDVRTIRGSYSHNLIEIADRDGLEKAQEALERVPVDEQGDVWRMVCGAYNTYCQGFLPSRTSHQECRMTLPLSGGLTVAGRADRVDIIPDVGALVLDWKLSCKTKDVNAEHRQAQMQRYLYPLMAAATFDVDVAGMMYVSLQHCRHEGSLTRSIPGLDGAFDLCWKDEAEAALVKAEAAIAGIERGDFWARGDKCPRWCSCHLEEKAQRQYV